MKINKQKNLGKTERNTSRDDVRKLPRRVAPRLGGQGRRGGGRKGN